MTKRPTLHAGAAAEKWTLLFIVTLVLILGTVTNAVSPLFEPPDEHLHYQFVRDLLDTRQLPVQLASAPPSQSHQPPLYYLGGAFFIALIPDSHILPDPNPFWAADRLAEVSRDNKRQFLPHPAHQWPYRDTALVVRLLRLWSTLLAAATAVTVWRIARLLWPHARHKRLAMTALVVGNPMFLYLAASINNDNLIILLGSLLILHTLRGLQSGFRVRDALLLGLLWGLALLTKLNGLVLAATWGSALLWQAWRQRNGRYLLTRALLITAVAATVAGWWFVRNQLIYGDPLALNILLAVWGERSGDAATLSRLWIDSRYAFTNFWGRFAYGQIPLPAPIYWTFALLSAGALAGGARVLWQRRPLRPAWFVLAVTAAAYAAAFTYFLLRNPTGANGRYVFPALPAYAALMVAGLAALIPQRFSRRAFSTGSAALGLLTAFILAVYLPWVYAPPTILSNTTNLPAAMRPLTVVFPGTATLLGYTLPEDGLNADQTTAITLYWQAHQPTAQPHHEFVQIIHNGQRLAGRDTHPGLGNYPTTLWQPGAIIVDPVPLTLPSRIGPGGVHIDVGLVDPDGARLTTDDGRNTITIGPLRLGGSQPPAPPGQPVTYTLDNLVNLTHIDPPPASAAPGETLGFELTWQARQPIPADYQTFVHLIDAGGALVATYDAPPAPGAFPTTLWQPGDVVVNRRQITLPANLPHGRYQFLTGWYNLETGARLTAVDAAGNPLQNNAISIFTITVE